MSYTYAQKRRGTSARQSEEGRPGSAGFMPGMSNSSMSAMLLHPTAADKGRRVDIPSAIKSRMEASFGMNFDGVKAYQSQAVADGGVDAVARGNEIAFAPGKFDMSSESGRALLGHELSHVASQARGEVSGSGFLNDAGLEARADREGAMAARGETVYGGAVAPLSSASAAPMAGPMQASGKKKNKEKKSGGQAQLSPEEKKAQMSADVDRLLAISAGKTASNDAVSKEDMDWYYSKTDSADSELLDMIQSRNMDAQRSLVTRRMYNGDENDKDADLDAAYGMDTDSMMSADNLLKDIGMSPNRDVAEMYIKWSQDQKENTSDEDKYFGKKANEIIDRGAAYGKKTGQSDVKKDLQSGRLLDKYDAYKRK